MVVRVLSCVASVVAFASSFDTFCIVIDVVIDVGTRETRNFANFFSGRRMYGVATRSAAR